MLNLKKSKTDANKKSSTAAQKNNNNNINGNINNNICNINLLCRQQSKKPIELTTKFFDAIQNENGKMRSDTCKIIEVLSKPKSKIETNEMEQQRQLSRKKCPSGIPIYTAARAEYHMQKTKNVKKEKRGFC